MKKFVIWLIGFVCGFGACLGAIAVWILILGAGSYHYVMEYPHTKVYIEKDKTVSGFNFDVKGNPRLPLLVRYADRVIALDAATTMDDVVKFLDSCGGKDYSIERRQKFSKGVTEKDLWEIYFSSISIWSKDGKNLSEIRMSNRNYPDRNDFAVETASGKRFVFPLDRKSVEELLGKDYSFVKQYLK